MCADKITKKLSFPLGDIWRAGWAVMLMRRLSVCTAKEGGDEKGIRASVTELSGISEKWGSNLKIHSLSAVLSSRVFH